MTLLPNWLTRRAQTHSAHPALVFEGECLTFAELFVLARGFENLLDQHQVGTGEVVATLLHNRPELVALAHAIPASGRIFAPLGVRLKAPEIATMLDACAARMLIYERATSDVVAALPRGAVEAVCLDDLPADIAAPVSGCNDRIDLDRTHTIVFTSGSSGAPKPVRLTWGNHYWSAMGSALNLGIAPTDRWLCCLPLNHVGGLSILVRSVLYGNTVELHARFDPDEANRAIRERSVTVVSVVANMLQRMLDGAGDQRYPPSLRAILVGGGATPAALIERCRSARLPILLTYGLTETASQVATVAPDDVALDCGVGRPLSFAEIRVTGDDGSPAAPGRHGHIEVRGPIVSPGYLGDDDRGPDEWLHTRDRGWIDGRGYLHVLGRGDETIVCGGENVHPREVERALENHPAVAEAFASGVDDEQWGAVFHAAVRITSATDETELAAHCRGLLANYKVPRRIFLVEDFPRTAAGKIARADAARELSALAKSM